MTCAELEILLCDYVDGSLHAEQRTALESHMAGCSACAELAKDVAGATAFLETVSVIEPRAELLTRQLPTNSIRGGEPFRPGAVVAKVVRRLGGIGSTASLCDGHGDDRAFVLDAGALRPYRAEAIASIGFGSGETMAGRRRSQPTHLGSHGEVLRQPETGDRDPVAIEGMDRAGTGSEGRQ